MLAINNFSTAQNPAWDVFQKAHEAMKTEKREQILSYMSGDKHKEFSKLKDFKKLSTYLEKVENAFVREFLHSDKNVRFLVIERRWSGRSSRVSQVFISKDGKWLWDRTISKEARNQQDVEVLWKRELSEDVIYQMKSIGRSVALFYADGSTEKLPNYKKMEIADSDLVFISPENKKKGKILLAEGFPYLGEATNVLGITSIPLYGYYLAVFDDGHVEQISPNQHKELMVELGLENGKGKLKERTSFKNELDLP